MSAPNPPAPTAARDSTVPQAAGVKLTVAGAATLRLNVPSGSVTAIPVSAAVLLAGFVKTSRSALVAPGPIVDGTKLLARTGAAETVRLAVAPVVVGALAAETLPTLLVCTPAVELVTWTVTVQLAPAASDAPESATLGPPAAATTAPPVQVVEAPGVPLFTMAAG